LSINVELPTDEGVKKLAPEKKPETIRLSMAKLRRKIEEKAEPTMQSRRRERFAPGGQSTQMIVGADKTSDDGILRASARLYGSYHLRRVYYSAFSPIPDSSSSLPLQKPPLMREHRLYQADWLMRFYGFSQPEILAGSNDGMLDLAIDPKLAWALHNRGRFPVDVNRAEREALLRVPGLGTKVIDRIIETRRYRRLRLEDIGRLCHSVAKVRPFIVAEGWSPGALTDKAGLRQAITRSCEQLSLF
jgi:predicted DNA-binding helix-hairpin-helix protein